MFIKRKSIVNEIEYWGCVVKIRMVFEGFVEEAISE